MVQTTLVFLLRDKEILLAMKKRSFGAGRFNGAGGKIEVGESITASAVRELKEELQVAIVEADLEKVAELNFFFPHRPAWDQTCHVFTTNRWQGEPTETEEMKPQWFSKNSLPFEEMWPDDKYWVPRMLAGEKLHGDFTFSDDGNNFAKFEIHEVPSF